jgi:hypothetical protein
MPRKTGTKGKKGGKRRARGDSTQKAVAKFAGDAYSVGARALSGLNALRKLINIETKYFDYTASSAQNSTVGVYYLTGITQGLTNVTRVGNSLRLQHYAFDIMGVNNASATLATFVRVILFRDNENAGAAPAATDLLVNATAPQSIISPYNWLNLNRFGILYDNVFQMDATNNLGFQAHFNIAHNGHIKFRGTDATASSAGEGSIWMFLWSNQATNTPTVTLYSRIAFTDD